jgi:hypothetical protein
MPQSPATPAAAFGASEPPRGLGRPMAGSRQRRERLVGRLLFAFSAVSILTTVGIVAVLVREAFSFFQNVSLFEFLTSTKWTPLFTPKHFGVLPLLAGSVLIAVGAAIVALPLGLASAIYLAEYAPQRARAIINPCSRFSRHPHGGVRLLRADVRDAAAQEHLAADRHLQRSLGRARHGRHDHSDGLIALGRRPERGAAALRRARTRWVLPSSRSQRVRSPAALSGILLPSSWQFRARSVKR